MRKKKGMLCICIAAVGYVIGKLIEISIKEVRDKSFTKIYTVEKFGVSDNGINLYPGDRFKVIEVDDEMAFIEIMRELCNQYFVAKEFLYEISDYRG